jgi:RNA polymerase sigma-70 factor (ECF subfamily)
MRRQNKQSDLLHYLDNLPRLPQLSERCSQREIIARAQRGEHEAFAALYALHQRRIYWLCCRMMKGVEEAEDLTQEVFMQVFRKIHTYRGESAFSTWLHRITVNTVLMRLRKRSIFELSVEEPVLDEDDSGQLERFGIEDPTLCASIDRIMLERAIDKLPPGYRLVFVLHDVEGYEHQEIAEFLGCSVGNTKSQLHKARLKLRRLLAMTVASAIA